MVATIQVNKQSIKQLLESGKDQTIPASRKLSGINCAENVSA